MRDARKSTVMRDARKWTVMLDARKSTVCRSFDAGVGQRHAFRPPKGVRSSALKVPPSGALLVGADTSTVVLLYECIAIV